MFGVASGIPTRGFTLVELAGVMIVLALISFTAIPAMTGMERAGAAGDRDAVETLVVLARQRAWATGRPHALRVANGGREASVVWLETFGGPAEPIPSSSGDESGDTRVLSHDPVAQVTVVAPGSGGALEVWFSAGGEPLRLEPSDDAGEPVSETVEIRFTNGAALSVLPRSGAVRW